MPARWGGSARLWATNIRLQPLGEKIKYPLTGRAVAQILMHYQPGIKIQRKVGRQHSLQGNNAIRKRHLADADPAPARIRLNWARSLSVRIANASR